MTNVCEREKIAKEIEKTSELIRKKHRTLKIGRIEEDIVLDKHFKLSNCCNRSFIASACAR